MSHSDPVDSNDLVSELSQALAFANDRLEETLRSDTADDDARIAFDEYLLHLTTLVDAGEALGFPVLSIVAKFVHTNAVVYKNKIHALRSDNELCELLRCWDKTLLPCISSPIVEESIGSLLVMLQQSAWAVAMQEEQVMAVAEALLVAAGEAQASVSTEQSPTQTKDSSLGIDVHDSASMTLDFATDLNADLEEAFLDEVPERVSKLTSIVVAFASSHNDSTQNKQVDVESLNEAQRHAHTIKGSANITGVYGLANVTHVLEDILEHCVGQEGRVGVTTTELLIDGCDFVSMAVDHLCKFGDPPENIVALLRKLLEHRRLLGIDGADSNTQVFFETPDASLNVDVTLPDGRDESGSSSALISRSSASKSSARVSVPVEHMDRVLNDAAELSIATVQLAAFRDKLKQDFRLMLEQQTLVQTKLSKLGKQLLTKNTNQTNRRSRRRSRSRSQAQKLSRRRFDTESLITVPLKTKSESNDMDSLEMDQYSEFHSELSVLTEHVTDVVQMLTDCASSAHKFDDLVLRQDRISREMTDLLMSTRMVTPASIVGRLERIVRQTCRTTGKKARLAVIGEDVEIDNEALSVVIDPLMHLLRNSIDHGIELPSDRLTIGKPEEGTITVSVVREGDEVEVRCSDDGRGFNYDRIREKCIELGHVKPDEEIDNADLARLTLLPGVSTAQSVTQVSGRGVGMDVVAAQITSYRGQIEVESVPGRGTTISMRLPLQMLTMHVLLIEEDNEVYALPSGAVNQLIFSDFGEFVQNEQDQQIFMFDDQRYEVMGLSNLLSTGDNGIVNDTFGNAVPLLLVVSDNRHVALVVDKPLNNERLVVKTPPSFMPRMPGFIGGAIRGDGSIAPVIDLRELIRLGTSAGINNDLFIVSKGVEETPPKVLVVDDSLSARRSLADLISDLGYDTRTAVDGLDAAEVMEEWPADMVFTDLEMPRMNGLQLTRYLRQDRSAETLPIVMVTSRSASKHRKLAEESGVSRYLTKPFNEDEVMDCLTAIFQSPLHARSDLPEP